MQRVTALLSSLSLVACTPGASMDSRVVADDQGVVPDLVCPGAAGCESADGPLSVGASARVITPLVEPWTDANGNGVYDDGEPYDDLDGDGVFSPVWMAGFDPGRAASGVHDDTWARALTLRRGELRVGVVALDLLGFSHDDVVRLRQQAQAAGLELDHVIVIATHTHESQDPLGFGGAHLIASGYDPLYNQRVIDQSIDALRDAIAREREARVTLGRTETPGLVGDSRMPIVIDDTLSVLRFDGDAGTIATLTVWGNHPEALGGDNTLISSDYPHYLRRDMEAAYPGSVAIFVPGALGGLMTPLEVVGCPDEVGRETCGNGTFEKAEYVGAGAARYALDALEHPLAEDDAATLALRVHPTFLRVMTPELLAAVEIQVLPRELFEEDGTRYASSGLFVPIDRVLDGELRIQSEVNELSIGAATLLLLPGEIYPELWLDRGDGESLAQHPAGADYPFAPSLGSFASAMPGDTTRIVVNQANDAIGYIIPQSQWDRLPPRAYVQTGQYGEGVSLGSHVEHDVHEAVTELEALR